MLVIVACVELGVMRRVSSLWGWLSSTDCGRVEAAETHL